MSSGEKNLFILLHGYGSNGSHLGEVAEAIHKGIDNCKVVCPNAPFISLSREDSYEWFPITELREDYFLEGLRSVFPYIENYIDNQASLHHIKHENIILGGFSQGACIAVYSALRLKYKIKCAISFSGGLVDYKNSIEQEMNHKVPVCLIHGEKDRIIPSAFSDRAMKILQKHNIPAEINLIDNLDHYINAESIDCCINFIKKLKH